MKKKHQVGIYGLMLKLLLAPGEWSGDHLLLLVISGPHTLIQELGEFPHDLWHPVPPSGRGVFQRDGRRTFFDGDFPCTFNDVRQARTGKNDAS